MLFGRIRRTVLSGFVVASTVVIAFVAGTVVLSRQIEAESAWVTHTREVQREIERYATSLSDIGAATRGYVITGEPEDLAEYRMAVTHAVDHIDRVRALTRDNASQQKRLVEMSEALKVRLNTAERTVGLRGKRGFSAARDEVLKGADLIEMTRLRLLIADLQLEEDHLLTQRERRLAQTASRLRTMLVALGVICVVALLPLYLALRRLLGEQESASLRDAELALHDPLTGLPNRRLLHDRLARVLVNARRNRTQAALLFLDLDGFKAVNDRHGHDVGDLLLEAVAERLTAARRETDTVARIAGDEFVVVLGEVRDAADVERVGEGVVASLCAPYTLGDQPIVIGVSIGWVLFPADAVEAGAMLRRADEALYAAKRAGKGRMLRRTEQWSTAALPTTEVPAPG